MDFSNRCRGCLSNDEETLQPLKGSSIGELFQDCVRLKVAFDPGLPKYLCGACYHKCAAWNKFKQQCIETHDLLNLKFGSSTVSNHEHISASENAVAPLQDETVASCLQEYTEAECNEVGITLNASNDDEIYEEQSEEVLEEFYLDDEVSEENIEDNPIHMKDEIPEETTSDEKDVDNPERNSDEYPEQCAVESQEITEKVVRSFTCKICKSSFSNSRALRRHMIKHQDSKRYVCIDCGKSYKFPTSLTLHKKSHLNNPTYVCELCGKSFIRAHGLKTHLLTHTTETPFACKNCPKKFKNEIMLRNHVFRTHSEVKNFSCSQCGKTFKTGAELKIHTRSHTNQKPFACSQCDKSYKTQSHLAVHFRAVHTSDRPYKCGLCPQAFAHRKVLKNHSLTHSSDRPFSCDFCQRTYRQKWTLVEHMKQHRNKMTRIRTAEDSIESLAENQVAMPNLVAVAQLPQSFIKLE
ncbi:zinc finger protein 771-like [Uranotaenia lowii]|uniref:zinc finger protein 771-like n=1 Tax=Uranotaenia lowii TaxID=190385 RepID=UPI00247A900B|nr:zinc finger protein 771-like [Uranotaenia lowii]